MADVMVDRRAAARFPVIHIAEITDISTGSKINARSSDLSRTGCYIDTLNPVPKGSRVRVRLVNGPESFECEGTVMYVSPGLGMGIAFQEPIAAEQLGMLDEWLNRASGRAR